MATEITNMLGKTLHVGQRVTHTTGWTGVVFDISVERGLVFVRPDDLSKLPRRDCYPLNDEAKARTGREEFCVPRDMGLTMRNYLEAGDWEDYWD